MPGERDSEEYSGEALRGRNTAGTGLWMHESSTFPFNDKPKTPGEVMLQTVYTFVASLFIQRENCHASLVNPDEGTPGSLSVKEEERDEEEEDAEDTM